MQKVLHVLFNHEEEKAMKAGSFGLDTHGVQHVVLQFERTRRPQPLITDGEVKMISHVPRTAPCKYCHEKVAPRGLWKHEKYCPKKKKGARP